MVTRFTLTFDCTSEAFSSDEASYEIARILRELANKIERYGDGQFTGKYINMRDVNGNVIGTWLAELSEDDNA